MNAERRHGITDPRVVVSKDRNGIWPFATATHEVSGLVWNETTRQFIREIVFKGRARNGGHAVRRAEKAINNKPKIPVQLDSLQASR